MCQGMWINVGLCPHGLQYDLKWGHTAATSDHNTGESHDIPWAYSGWSGQWATWAVAVGLCLQPGSLSTGLYKHTGLHSLCHQHLIMSSGHQPPGAFTFSVTALHCFCSPKVPCSCPAPWRVGKGHCK